MDITVAVHVAVQLTQRVLKPFNGGAGGARTHDPRISISACFIGFAGRNF